jgi:hypothetical protein
VTATSTSSNSADVVVRTRDGAPAGGGRSSPGVQPSRMSGLCLGFDVRDGVWRAAWSRTAIRWSHFNQE